MQPIHVTPSMLACAAAINARDVNAAIAAVMADLPADARALIALGAR